MSDVYCIGGQVRVRGQGEGQPVRELGCLQARHPTQTDLNIMLSRAEQLDFEIPVWQCSTIYRRS